MSKDFRNMFEIEDGKNCFALKMPSVDVKTFMIDGNGVTWVEMVKKGEYYYYGEVITIGDQEFQNAIRNFNDGLTNGGKKCDLLFDYDHDFMSTKAAGWITDLKVSDDGSRLLGKVDWSASGKASIESDEYRYTSIEFSVFYYKRELIDGQYIEIDKGFTLFACTLTNRPFVKGMEKVTLSEKKHIAKEENKIQTIKNTEEGDKMEFKQQFEEATVKLSETSAKLEEANQTLVTLQKENDELKGKIALSEKNAEFDSMMQNGKVVEAQREHFINGDMVSFAKAFSALPMKEVGTSEESQGEKISISERAGQLAKEKNITFSEAVKIAAAEQKKEGN